MKPAHSTIRAALLFAIGNALTGCSQSPPEEQAPPEVQAALPLVRTIVDYEEFTGRIDAVDAVQIKSRVSGYLDSIAFKQGDEVHFRQNEEAKHGLVQMRVPFWQSFVLQIVHPPQRRKLLKVLPKLA